MNVGDLNGGNARFGEFVARAPAQHFVVCPRVTFHGRRPREPEKMACCGDIESGRRDIGP